MSAGVWRGADPGCAANCNTAWGWPCSCGAKHDVTDCGLLNCRMCWEAEWPRPEPRMPDRFVYDDAGLGTPMWRCRNFARCGWYVEQRDSRCEECSMSIKRKLIFNEVVSLDPNVPAVGSIEGAQIQQKSMSDHWRKRQEETIQGMTTTADDETATAIGAKFLEEFYAALRPR